MRITKLSATNFKGRSFEHELSPVTMFCGPNFIGKSARVEALTLALAGYLPGIPRKPNEIFERLASGNPLEVEARGDNALITDFLFVRKWKQERGSVKYNSMGRDIPPVAIDATEYLGLSDAERVKFLFSVAKLPAECNVEALLNRIIADIKNIKLVENTPATEAVIKSVIAMVISHYEPILGAQEWLEVLTATCKERKLGAEATVRRLSQTSQGLTQIADDQTPAPPDSEARLSKAKELLRAAEANFTMLNTKLEQCREEYREASATVSLSAELPKYKRLLQELEEKKQRTRHVAKPEPQELLLKAEQEAREVKLKKDGVVSSLQEAIKSLEAHIAKASHARVCPTCGQSVKGEKKSILNELNKNLRAQQRGLKMDKVSAKEATAVWQAAKDALDGWLVRNESYAQCVQDLRNIDAQIAATKLDIAKCGNAGHSAEKIETLKATGKQLAEDVQKAKTTKEGLELLVADCETSVRQLLAERAEAQSRAKAITAVSEAKAETEVLKAVYAILGALLAELVDGAVAPLIKTCNELCGNILKSPLVYRDGEIGRWSERGNFITHLSFSGTEKALTHAAVSIALASNAPLKLVILDEMGRLDAGNKATVLLRLVQLVKQGIIDQAVLVDTIVPDLHHDLFKVVELKN